MNEKAQVVYTGPNDDGRIGTFQGNGFRFELYNTPEDAYGKVDEFNRECVNQECKCSLYWTVKVYHRGSSIGYINIKPEWSNLIMWSEGDRAICEFCRIY